MNGDGNFKMKCIKAICDHYTENKIYKVVDGYWITDTDILIGHSDIKTIKDVNEFSSSIWKLVKDETSEQPLVSERMEKVASMLGLELDEEFNINLSDGSPSSGIPYKFTEHNLVNNRLMPVNGLIGALLTGRYTIERLKWKPKDGDTVWYIFSSKHAEESWCESCTCDSKNTVYVALYKMGWLFKTEAEAEANMERVLKEMKEVIEK